MLLKSLTAGVILAGLAGGAVYYGMGEELADRGGILQSEKHPAPEVKAADAKAKDAVSSVVESTKSTAESAKDKVSEMIGRKPKSESEEILLEDEDQDSSETLLLEDSLDPDRPKAGKPKKRWLDEYLKSEQSEEDDASEAIEAATENVVADPDVEETPDETPVRQPDTVMKTVEAVDEVLEDGSIKTTTTTVTETIYTDGTTEKQEDIAVTIQAAPDSKPEEKEISEADNSAAQSAPTPMMSKATSSFKVESDPEVMELLLTEAEKLDIPDMRDQAYLNIVDYALSKGDRDRAESVLAQLSREELRDTARGRVAVSLAQAGRMEAAFAVLEELEIKELQDPIRLQIIEAATSGNPAIQ